MKITKLFGLLAATISLGLASCNTPTPAPQPSYTAAVVAEDFNANVTDAGLGEYIDPAALDDHNEYSTFAVIDQSDDESEASLQRAAAILASFLPEYMTAGESVYGDPTAENYFDIFGDQSYYYYMDFASPDDLSYAVILSYVYSGYLCAQISIADAANLSE